MNTLNGVNKTASLELVFQSKTLIGDDFILPNNAN